MRRRIWKSFSAAPYKAFIFGTPDAPSRLAKRAPTLRNCLLGTGSNSISCAPDVDFFGHQLGPSRQDCPAGCVLQGSFRSANEELGYLSNVVMQNSMSTLRPSFASGRMRRSSVFHFRS